MLLKNSDRLDERIILALSKKDSAPASWLHQRATLGDRSYTLQAVYKELAKLQKRGVVVKHGGKYSLNLTWILGQIELIDLMYKTHILGGLAETIFPEKGKRSTWRFSNLSTLDDFVMHLTLALLECSPSKKMYQWLPYPWIRLLQTEKGKAFQEAVITSGSSMHTALKQSSFTDHNPKAFTSSKIYKYFFRRNFFNGKNNLFYYAVDDYLLTLKLDKQTLELFKNLHYRVRSLDDFYRLAGLELMSVPVKVTAKLEHGTRASKVITEELIRSLKLAVS